MKSQNPIETMDVYASTSQYIDGPTTEQQAAGTVPLDTLPADWWNWLWKEMTTRINQASNGMESVYQEVLSVLQAADITPSDTSNTQLLTSINALITKPGTSSTAGTVKSSSASGKVSIDTNGIMTPNGMGVPSSLSTTAKTIVSAINEIFTALNTYKSTNDAAVAGKAPTSHASSATTYGKGDSTNYGHVKLSDSTDSTSGVADGIAATPAAVSSVAKELSNYKSTNDAAVAGKAPTSHASSATTYGKGDSTNYGHVKLSDSTDSTSGVADGIAATPAAVKKAYDLANKADKAAATASATATSAQTAAASAQSNAQTAASEAATASATATSAQTAAASAQATADSKPSLGSSKGSADTSNGSSGSSSTAARSDHTHPYPGLVYNGSTKSKVTFTLSGNILNITTTSV